MKEKEVVKEKELDYIKIAPEKLQELEAELSILNPYFLKYVSEALNKVIEPVYKEGK